MARQTIVISINASWNIVNFRAGLVQGLVAAGYRVIALAPVDGFSDRLKALGIEHISLPMDSRGTSALKDLKLLWQYWRLLGRIAPDAYLGYTIKPNIYGSIAAKLRGIPVINNIAGLGETFVKQTAINRLVTVLYRLALKRSAVVFFQNPDDRALFITRKLVTSKDARLLPGSGIDLDRFSPPPARHAGTQAEFRFLLVTRLLWAKGVADYVEAARIVHRTVPNATFGLLGLIQEGRDAIDRTTLDQWGADGSIKFLGGTDDVRPFLAMADCVVLPTFYPEGTPRSLLEAAAMARPIIASDVAGCREIVSHGENGFLVPAHNSAALAEAMLQMTEKSVAQITAMGRASRAKAEREFDERIVIGRYLAALDDAIGP